MNDERGVHTVGGILYACGAILLGLRSPHRRSCPLHWDVIGGHVEMGETPRAALAREVREEIGVIVVNATQIQDVSYRARADRPATLRLFLVDRWQGDPAIANDEHVDLRWFDPAVAARLEALALDEYRPVFDRLSRRHAPAAHH